MRQATICGVAMACGLAGMASASTFDIVFDVPDAATPGQRAVLAQTESLWESVVTGYRAGISIDALEIAVAGVDRDGPGGVLAFAGPDWWVERGGYTLPTAGSAFFDNADLAWLEEEGLLLTLAVHEVAHVMGFGTLWPDNGVYEDGTGAYVGASGLARYRDEFDRSAAFVPVELDGGPGTRDGHWDEWWAGGEREVMTGWIDYGAFLSDTTIASFRDLGYEVALAPIPLPSAGWLSLGAFALLGGLARRGAA